MAAWGKGKGKSKGGGAVPGRRERGVELWGCGFCVMWDGYLVLPSGYVKIAIENGDL